MNAKFVRMWIAALRSGDYPQTHGHHREGEAYCALGLGYALTENPKWIQSPLFGNGAFAAGDGLYVVPTELREQSGLRQEDLIHIALYLNDAWKMPFSRIADHLEGLLSTETAPKKLAELA